MKRLFLFLFALGLAFAFGCDQLNNTAQPSIDQTNRFAQDDDDDPAADLAEIAAFKTRMAQLAEAYRARVGKVARQSGEAAIQGSKITVPDDYATIQEAVDNAAPGTKIKIKDRGSPYDEDVVVMTDDLRLTGEGGPTLAGSLSLINCSSVQVDNFTINDTGTLNGIDISKCEDVTIKDMVIDAFDHGISAESCSELLIKDNVITAADREPIHLFTSDHCEIDENVLNATDDDGLELDNCNHNEITGNHVAFAAFEGIELDEDSDDNEVSENNVSGVGQVGIEVDSEADNNELKDNLCNSVGESGIEIRGDNNNVSDNECSGNGDDGIRLVSGAEDNEIGSGNTCSNNSERGIHLQSGANNNTVKKNQACGNGISDITDNGSGNTLKKNETGACD